MITIIDYGVGNFKSIQNILNRLGVPSLFTSEIKRIEESQKIILPGVGHFDHGIKNLEEKGLLDILNSKVIRDKTPILGICLGAQLMTQSSDEGRLPGLGWVKGKTVKFQKELLPPTYKIPHMGWSDVQGTTSDLAKGLMQDARFYFVHSYYMKLERESDVLFTANYGHPFHAGFALENIFGVQFHPEKSHHFGMQLLQNFSNF